MGDFKELTIRENNFCVCIPTQVYSDFSHINYQQFREYNLFTARDFLDPSND